MDLSPPEYEESRLLKCDAVPLGEELLTFQRIIVAASSDSSNQTKT
jgi:hypothetical protein